MQRGTATLGSLLSPVGMLLGLRGGEMAQSAGEDAPATVAFQPLCAMGAHPRKAVVASQTLDASLDACPPAIAAFPVPLVLASTLLSRHRAGPWNDDVLSPQGADLCLHAFRMEAAITGEEARRTPKDLLVVLCCWQRLVTCTLVVVGEDVEAGDGATRHCVEDDLATERYGDARLGPRACAGVRLEQTQHVLERGHVLALEDASVGPVQHAPNAGEERSEARLQALGAVQGAVQGGRGCDSIAARPPVGHGQAQLGQAGLGQAGLGQVGRRRCLHTLSLAYGLLICYNHGDRFGRLYAASRYRTFRTTWRRRTRGQRLPCSVRPVRCREQVHVHRPAHRHAMRHLGWRSGCRVVRQMLRRAPCTVLEERQKHTVPGLPFHRLIHTYCRSRSRPDDSE